MYTIDSLKPSRPLNPDAVNNLVFSGGGILGIAYMGVQYALESLGISDNIKNFAGASAGAIYAMLGACGYKADDLKKLVFKKSFADLLGDANGDFRVPKVLTSDWYAITHIGQIIQAIGDHRGLCKGELARQWFAELIVNAPGNIAGRGLTPAVTFSELENITGHGLYVIGCDITSQEFRIFCPRDTPNESVLLAVIASMSIPFVFEPRLIGNHWFVDGGTTKDMPLDIGDPFEKTNTLGLLLDSRENFLHPKEIDATKVLGFVSALFGTILRQGTVQLFRDPQHIDQTVFIDPCGISQIDFDITVQQKNKLALSGLFSVYDYFGYPQGSIPELPPELLFTQT